MDETQLTGGNATGGAVVRVGDTVRKPWHRSTPSVTRYVAALRSLGVPAPAPMGRDEAGRSVQEFVPGALATSVQLQPDDLRLVGAMVRDIHDASALYTPGAGAVWETAIAAPGSELVCHNDLAPWNLLVGDRWMFIDWDASAPSTRLWDLAYAAVAFTMSNVEAAPKDAASDLAALVDGYDTDADLRCQLPDAMAERTNAMVHLLESSRQAGAEPWASMETQGHGAHWRAVRLFVTRNREVWVEALRSG